MLYREQLEKVKKAVVLVDYSPGYRLGDFDCGISDYNDFLVNDAQYYIDQNISQVKLLIDKQNANIVGYMALNADSFRLDEVEKEKEDLKIPFTVVPALKIGKLAISKECAKNYYGTYMLWLALGFVEKLNESGVGARFIVVDADTKYDSKTPDFYHKNGFVLNEKMNKGRNQTVSMRYDIFDEN